MISEKHIKRINKVIKDMVFDFKGDILTYGGNIEIQYQFVITGQRKMISVGEYYDYLEVSVEIVGANDRAMLIFSVFQKLNANVTKDYIFQNKLVRSISDELQYFFGGDYVRVNIMEVKFSEELQEEIDSINLENNK
jgi:hypothetical protein